MTLTPAPFFQEIAGGPPDGTAFWVETTDNLRLRIGYWPLQGAKGTVLVLPGRTEYLEKYNGFAAEMASRGYAALAIDWRGQGLSDRLIDDVRVGHVEKFTDYQKDVAAALRVARHADLPRPWHMLGHSMGGAIGLRAVMEGLPVQTCAFSAPMFGIFMSPLVKPFGWALSQAAPVVGMGTRLPPSTRYEHYVLSVPFEGNILTRDPDMFALMQSQLTAHPELALGGPSLIWLREALFETRHLAGRASPDMSCITFLGAEEKIVDVTQVHARMAIWPRGTLDLIPDAEHEVLMEVEPVRRRIFDRLAQHFAGVSTAGASQRRA
jgi:lysophospholipase